jgi:hypothetical protein
MFNITFDSLVEKAKEYALPIAFISSLIVDSPRVDLFFQYMVIYKGYTNLMSVLTPADKPMEAVKPADKETETETVDETKEPIVNISNDPDNTRWSKEIRGGKSVFPLIDKHVDKVEGLCNLPQVEEFVPKSNEVAPKYNLTKYEITEMVQTVDDNTYKDVLKEVASPFKHYITTGLSPYVTEPEDSTLKPMKKVKVM